MSYQCGAAVEVRTETPSRESAEAPFEAFRRHSYEASVTLCVGGRAQL